MFLKRRFYYRPLVLMLAALYMVFAPLGSFLDARMGKMQSHAFAVEIALGYSIWEILAACACAVGGIVLSFEVSDRVQEIYNDDFRGYALKRYFDEMQESMSLAFQDIVSVVSPDYDLSDLPDLDLNDYETIDNTSIIMERYYKHLLELDKPVITDPEIQELIDLFLEAFLDQLSGLSDDAFSGDAEKESKEPVTNGTAQHDANQKLCDYLNYIIHSFEANSTFYQPGYNFTPGDDSTIVLSAYTLNMLLRYVLQDYNGIKLSGNPEEIFYTALNNGEGLYTCTGGSTYDIYDRLTGFSATLDFSRYNSRYAFALYLTSYGTSAACYRTIDFVMCDTLTGKRVDPSNVIDPSTYNPVRPAFTINYTDEFQAFLDSVLGSYTWDPLDLSMSYQLAGTNSSMSTGYKALCGKSYTDLSIFQALYRLHFPLTSLGACANYKNQNGASAYTVLTLPCVFDGIPLVPSSLINSFGQIGEELPYKVNGKLPVDIYNKSITISSDNAIKLVDTITAGGDGSTFLINNSVSGTDVIMGAAVDSPSGPDVPIVPGVPVDPVNPGGANTSGNPDLDSMQIPQSITDKFPFCVPFDLINCVKVWNVPSKAPVWEFPFVVESLGINEKITIDLTMFDSVTAVFRFLILLSYIVFLIVLTRQIIKG